MFILLFKIFLLFLILFYCTHSVYYYYIRDDESNMMRYILISLTIFMFLCMFRAGTYIVPFDFTIFQFILFFLVNKKDNERFFTQKNLINYSLEFLLIVIEFNIMVSLLDIHISYWIPTDYFEKTWVALLYYSPFLLLYFIYFVLIIRFLVYCDKKQLKNIDILDINVFTLIMYLFFIWHLYYV